MLPNLLTPFQNFVKAQNLSSALLLFATFLALVCANSPLSNIYNDFISYEIGIYSSKFKLVKPLFLWVNDGFMTIFFFVIGLEIKRELLVGELNSIKKAAMPIFAAIGGMIFPIIIYLILNSSPVTQSGWGIPMATDIAFVLALLALLNDKIPLSLKVFVTAFAIIDDLGAVLAIAIFYTETLHWNLLLIAFAILAFLFVLSYFEIYYRYHIVLFGVVIWFLFLKGGIHPTVAGVLLALTVPMRQRIGIENYSKELHIIAAEVEKRKSKSGNLLSNKQIILLDNIEKLSSKVQSPLQHLEHRLHNWVSYFIMPTFAFFNAGVVFPFNNIVFGELLFTIPMALILGNCIGICLFVYITAKLNLIEIPKDIKPFQIAGVSILAGVGFTMSIFISGLAFPDNDALLNTAKMSVFLGSFIAAVIGYCVLYFGK